MKNEKILAFTLTETLITLGIIGIVAALLLPATIGNIEKRKNEVVLQKAYSDLNKYLEDFTRENDCTTNFSDCYPENGSVVWQFAKYLYEKQKFKDLNILCAKYTDINCNTWLKIRTYPKASATTISSYYKITSPNKGAYYIVSPTGLYAYLIAQYMYDNHYHMNKDYFRARIFIATDSKKLGEIYESRFGGDGPKTPQMGKNFFEAYIVNSKKIVPNGASDCTDRNWNYYCTSTTQKPCAQNNEYSTCLQQIISDGWKIKYKY